MDDALIKCCFLPCYGRRTVILPLSHSVLKCIWTLSLTEAIFLCLFGARLHWQQAKKGGPAVYHCSNFFQPPPRGFPTHSQARCWINNPSRVFWVYLRVSYQLDVPGNSQVEVEAGAKASFTSLLDAHHCRAYRHTENLRKSLRVKRVSRMLQRLIDMKI